MKYGNRIARLRAEKELTQGELAEKVSISRASLSHYENDRREPDLDVLAKLADFFGVTLDFLMGRTNEPGRSLDPEVKDFVESLELADESIIQKFQLTIDGRELTSDEARRFIAFIRAERQMRGEA
ncbi:helix-turn-helix domain-containing protein [Gorillibacterium timonense]|uniref:helix-turn-helix domain-containing protein n=1 Tax=Gorillibacterium timonense TaxID=1689269 RepID=UPI00071E28DC|nr:helix-turn-helix domain-containing protein [Gorillibacterium timonense]